jgi:betaine-homocysteine S-methyltransferase
VLEHPELVEGLHREFVHAGSDVVEAFTYYAHREKLRVIGREQDLERINRKALEIAGKVARETGTMVAGNICNTGVFTLSDAASAREARAQFDEQLQWAVDAGVDFVIGETYSYASEALVAVAAMKETKLPVVVTLAIHAVDATREGWDVAEACRKLADAGADVVGLNCARGPKTMLPLLEKIVAAVAVPVAALPVPYRTTAKEPNFQSLTDPGCDCLPRERPFPTALDPFTCNHFEIADFAKKAYDIGVHYLGICCGAGPHHIRAMAEALGRKPGASRYTEDMSKHYVLGSHPSFRKENLEYRGKLQAGS